MRPKNLHVSANLLEKNMIDKKFSLLGIHYTEQEPDFNSACLRLAITTFEHQKKNR